MEKTSLAAAAATALQGAAVISNLSQEDQARAEGVYTLRHIGPKEEFRDEYVALRDQAWELERAGEIAEAAILRAKMLPMEEVKSEELFANLVTTVGKNFLLDNGLAGSAYTASFFLGLISSVSYTAVAAADTMTSHAGWLEAGSANAPTYSQANRPTAAWSAAASGSKSLSAALTFSITSAGTVKGAFLTTNSTKDGTTGTLYSAGTFTGGDKIVANGDTLSVSYTASL